MNSRLDTLQAAILCEKLAIFPKELQRRGEIAARYSAALDNFLSVPKVPEGLSSTWAQYTARTPEGACRQDILKALKKADIPVGIYYPTPLHRQTAYSAYINDPAGLPISEEAASAVFSLPMHPYLTQQDQDRVIQVLHDALV